MRKIICNILLFFSLTFVFSQSRKIEVWDFGGISDTRKNTVNHIALKDIEAQTLIANDGKFTLGDVVFGDLTYNAVANDRAYNGGKKNYGTQGYSSFDFEDGYVSGGMFYCNGTGGEARRYILLKNVKAGDIITFYARLSNTAQEKINLVHVDSSLAKTGKQAEKADIEGKSKKYEYIATQDGIYKIYTDTNGGKPVFYRVVRTPGVEITGKLDGASKSVTLKFVNQTTNQEINAKVSGASYNVSLSAGYTWTAILGGMTGYTVRSEDKVLNIKLNDIDTGRISKNLTVAEQKTYKITGNITGLDDIKEKNKVGLSFVPPAGQVYQSVTAKVEAKGNTLSYTAALEPAVIYTASLIGANDYEIKEGSKANNTQNTQMDIICKVKEAYNVTGKYFSANANFTLADLPQKLNFLNEEDNYNYEGIVKADGTYSAKLRSGTYKVLSESTKFIATNHIIVDGKDTSRNIKMSLKDKTLQALPLKKDITVGAKSAYKTVTSAVEAVKAMNPQSEAQRVNIHIEPGVYREQIIIDTPYITLLNDNPDKEVKLTWYYGIGYRYYSVSKDGFYDDDLAYDKMGKAGPARWGVATYIKPQAKYFKAKNITFEASFNKYVTDEEIADGVEPDGSLPFTRKINSDVMSKAATERSSAICSEGDFSEFLNCRFLGSQDTLYTGAGTRQYYRKCFIEGNTDFIFGDGDVVFENCEIHWAGYTDRSQGGYLTAARNAVAKGYLFYNCLISQETSLHFCEGMFGRPWGANAKVSWINTVLGTDTAIHVTGWTGMSGNTPEKANFREYGTTWAGKAVDTSDRTKGTVLKNLEGYTPNDFLESWKPEYMAEGKSVAKANFKKAPSFTTDDDINTPYPGHTITLHYTLGKGDSEDASVISWYRVLNGQETLIKQSTGYGDKTYLLSKADTGSKIKATVHAFLRSGKDLGEKSVTLDVAIKEGVGVPSKAKAEGGARIADKINIFLAGDSTVKDYSAEGMWSANTTRNEGAWGEFLQDYFGPSVAVENYANGGRSSRNFINEGSLDKIKENIGKGDYLFIQFGHNDCSNASGYLEDRYVPLGKPNGAGIYPIVQGKKVPTPSSYSSRYGKEFYSYDCGGTYKWYLLQYINVARDKGAIPVLITPVSRQYFTPDGKIKPHHDSTDTTTKTQVTENNAYVEAVRQLAKEENVILLDGFALTSALYEDSYTKGGVDKARELMFTGDSTHNNKLGGFVIAGLFAKEIKATIKGLAPSVKVPKKAIGENLDGKLMFTVDSKSEFTCDSPYWTQYMKTLFSQLAK